MLKQQLRYTLLFFMAVVIALGGTGIYLLKLQDKTHQHGLRGDYGNIRAAHSVPYHTTRLNVRYLTRVGQLEKPEVTDRTYFDSARSDMLAEAETIVAKSEGTEAERPARQLKNYALLYLATMSSAVTDPPDDYKDRRAIVAEAADLTVKISAAAETVIGINEAQLMSDNIQASARANQAVTYLAVVSGVALIASWFLVRHLGRAVLEPIEGLEKSIREVKKGNFELSVPVVGHHELASLSSSFNEMASELAVFRRETDQQLVDLHNRNQAIFQTFPHPIFLLGEKGEVLSTYPQADRFRQLLELGDRLPKKVIKIVTEAIASEEDYLPENPSDALLFRLEEQETFYLPRLFHIFDSAGVARGWALILSDISRVRWLDDIKTNMIATISHEIKTPLTSIRMMLHLLCEKNSGELNEAQTEMATYAMNDCERLLTTLEKLLDISSRDSGSPDLDLLATKPHVLFEPVRHQFEAEAEAKNVKVEVDLPSSLPYIQTDPIRIQQVMSNLLHNAIKYCPEGGLITVRAVKEGADFVRFLVSDSGPGVPLEAQDRIFDRFYRAPDQELQGTGLGLSISREIINAHDGRIGLLSDPAEPTTFYFDLPLT